MATPNGSSTMDIDRSPQDKEGKPKGMEVPSEVLEINSNSLVSSEEGGGVGLVDMTEEDESQSEPSSLSSESQAPAPRAKRRLTVEEETVSVKGGDSKPAASSSSSSSVDGVHQNLNLICSSNLFEKHVAEVEIAMDRLTSFLTEHTVLIKDVDVGRAVIDQMLIANTPVAVDCEGVNLGDRVNGKVTLVQLGDVNGSAYLFDVHVEVKLAGELKRLLECEDVVKVMHDCRSDSEGLDHQFKIKLKNVFDTQAAHQVLQKSSGVEKIDKNSGLDKICRTYGGRGASNPFKDTVKGVYKKNQSFWTARPLTPLMISYAASDVLCLVPRVYNELNRRIVSEEDKQLFAQLVDQHINPPVRERHDKRKGFDKNRKRGRGAGVGHGGGHGRGGGTYSSNQNYAHAVHSQVVEQQCNPSSMMRDRGYFQHGGAINSYTYRVPYSQELQNRGNGYLFDAPNGYSPYNHRGRRH